MNLKRISLFEFEDYPWFPNSLRQYLTLYIVTFHRLIGTCAAMIPLLQNLMAKTGHSAIIDICSGAGGPMLDLAHQLKNPEGESVPVTLTDLYPNRTTIESIKKFKTSNVRYLEQPVNAADVPADLGGVRTMVSSFHHMPPEVARSILKDAFQKRQPLCVFEISDNSAPTIGWWLPLPVAFLLVFLITPFVRPLSAGQLFWTYVIPVLPAVIAWDGVASNARTYSKDDLEKLTSQFKSEDYHWEIGLVRRPFYPSPMLYLLGIPHTKPKSKP